jgi:hypothetical protein
VLPVAVELAVDADQSGVEVDVAPDEAEGFADAQAGVGEEVEEESVGTGVCEQEGELVGFEDGRSLREPARLLRRFELRDRVIGKPAAADGEAADGEAADLAERDQRIRTVVVASARSFACDQAAT